MLLIFRPSDDCCRKEPIHTLRAVLDLVAVRTLQEGLVVRSDSCPGNSEDIPVDQQMVVALLALDRPAHWVAYLEAG